MGLSEEIFDVIIHATGLREAFIQFINDIGNRPLAVDQLQNKRRTVVEFRHPFRIQNHVAVLRFFKLHAVAATKHWCVVFGYGDHRSRPLCQTACCVTLWYGGRLSS